MPVNSKQKGKRGELEFSHWLKKNLGINARRGQQFKGTEDSPDVVSDLSGLHFECKRTECLSVQKAMAQAEEDAGDKVPIIAHRRNRGEWLLILKAKDAEMFSHEIIQRHKRKKDKKKSEQVDGDIE